MKNLNKTRKGNRLLSLESKFLKHDNNQRKSTSKGIGSYAGMLTASPNDHWIGDDGQIQTKVGTSPQGGPSTVHRFFTYQPELGTGYGLAETLTENAAGLVEFPATGTGFERYGGIDAGGTDDGVVHGSGDHWLQPITAAALFGLSNKLNRDHGFVVAYGDMSSSNGSDPWEPGSIHHKGHGHGGNRIGVDIDFRYLNNSGRSFQAKNAFEEADFSATNNQRFFDTARTFGFTANYQGPSGTLTGITKVKGHDNHGHIGLTLASVNWVQQQAVGGISIVKSIPDTARAFTTPQTWDTHTNTRIQEIHPDLRTTVANFINHMESTHGMQLRVGNNPFRTFAEQDAEYARGRTAPGGIVTNARAGQSYHNYGLAVDVVEVHPHYGYEKGYDQRRWDTIGQEAINAGFVWGGNFTTIVDKPHIEMSFGFTTAQLLVRYNNGNFLPGTQYVDLRPNLSAGNSWSGQMTLPANISNQGIQFIKNCEGFGANVYNDAGHLAIGYGHNLSATDEADFRAGRYQYQNGITEAQADTLLRNDVAAIITTLQNRVTVNMSQSQFDATISYIFNVGAGNSLDRQFGVRLNAGNYAGAAREMDIITSNGEVLAGLVRRRNAEYDLFVNGVYGNKDNYSGTQLSWQVSRSQGLNEQFSTDFPSVTSEKFKAFLPTILRHEGGFVNDPDDPGGATNKGVTFKTFQRHAQSVLGVEPTMQNLRAITDDQAGEIYELIYWNRVKGEQINDVQVAYQFVDFYINAGGNAIRVMQRTLNEMGQHVEVDGGMGEKTLAAINAVNGEALFNNFKANRLRYYEQLVIQKPTSKKYLKGWTNRTNSFVYGSVGLSGSKSFEMNFWAESMGYGFVDGMHRVELTGNGESRVHSRWVKKGLETPAATRFKAALVERKKEAYNTTKATMDLFKANIYAVADALDVENSALYLKSSGDTFCNVYAYHVVSGLGAYLPRLWWTLDVEKKMLDGTLTPDTVHAESGMKYKNIYGKSITQEQNANMLNAWFERVGEPHFGWEKATDMDAAQTAANNGHIVIINAAKTGGHGHISVILPELPSSPAKKPGIPLQSQAGETNFKIGRGGKWWSDSKHSNGHAWIYKGEIKSPIIASGAALGGAYA